MRKLSILFGASLALFYASLSAQTIVLESFNPGNTTGAARSGTTWFPANRAVLPGDGTLVVGNGALNDNGWGVTFALNARLDATSVSSTGFMIFQVTAKLDPINANAAGFINLQLEDSASNTAVATIATNLFNTTSFTTVNSGAFFLQSGSFNFASITGWTFGGGDPSGLSALNITFDSLALAVPEPSTYALLALGLGLVAVPVFRRRRS